MSLLENFFFREIKFWLFFFFTLYQYITLMCYTFESVQAMKREKGRFCTFGQNFGGKCLPLTAVALVNQSYVNFEQNFDDV